MTAQTNPEHTVEGLRTQREKHTRKPASSTAIIAGRCISVPKRCRSATRGVEREEVAERPLRGWVMQERGWWTNETHGGICRERGGWWVYRSENRPRGPYKTAREAAQSID